MKRKKLLFTWEIFIVVWFTIWLVAFALSFPKLAVQTDRFQLFIRIMQFILIPVIVYQITPQLRSRLFGRNPKNDPGTNSNEIKI